MDNVFETRGETKKQNYRNRQKGREIIRKIIEIIVHRKRGVRIVLRKKKDNKGQNKGH